MADVDPRIRQFEEEAAKTLAAMKRSSKRADEFIKDEGKRGAKAREDLDSRVRKEVARDRIKGETIGGESSSGRKTKRSLEDQSRATRQAAREQERMTTLQDKARVSEERLTKTRKAATRETLTQAEAERRYGSFAGRRYAQTQGPGATVLTRDEARSRAVSRQGEFAGGGGFDRRYPPPPPPPPPSGGGGRGGGFDDGGQKRFNAELTKEQQNLRRLEGSLQANRLEHQRLTQVQASGSNVLRRNGALTTEFIQAAARGEVTIRELGYQTASTIGKFGGWITAGAALYTALGAVQKLGAGALDAASGVNQLQRVVNNINGDDLQEGFSGLADYFQLPVGEVTEGVYEIGKVFHDQNDALEASKALLYSVKVGELDTATAGRYLIGITNAYNLSQQDLNDTFDKFNQLQNNFGVAIAGTEAATSRAAGSFVNAGGSLDYLIALIGTASKVTGAAPERIGTALQRSPTFIHKPANEQVLKSFGIDPTQDLDSIYDQAFKVAQKLSGKRRRQLGSALLGPQYGASIGTPVLRQFDLFKKIKDSEEGLAGSKGSGERELAILKGSPEEQLKNIGIQLERLGIGIAQSGVLDEIGYLVLGIDDVLRLTNSVVEAFNDLPGPLKTAVALMVQLSLASRLLGRLNLGETRPGQQAGPGRAFAEAAFQGGDRRDARLIRKGLYDEKTTLEDERVRAADRARDQASRAVLAEERAIGESKKRVKLTNAGLLNEKTINESKAAEAVYLEERDAATRERVKATFDEEHTAQRLTQAEQRIEKSRGRLGRLNVAKTLAVAEGRGPAYSPTSFDVPTTSRPGLYVPSGGTAPGVIIPDALRNEEKMAQAEKEAQRSTRKMSKLNVGAQRVGSAFNRLLGSMGNLIFGAFIIGAVAELLGSQADKLGDEIDRINTASTSTKSRAENLKRLTAGGGSGDNFNQRLANIFTETTDVFGVGVPSLGLGNNGIDESINEAERIAADTIRAEMKAQRRARKTGAAVPYRYASEIEKDIQTLQEENLPAAKTSEQLKRYREELAKSYEATNPAAGKGSKAALKKAYEQLRDTRVASAGPKGLQNALAGLDPAEVQERLEAEITQAGFFGGLTKNRISRARQVYAKAVGDLGASENPKDIQQLADARSSFFEGLQGAIQNELDHALAITHDPRERNAAYAAAFSRYSRAYGGGGKAVTNERRKLKSLERQFGDLSNENALHEQFDGVFGVAGPDTKGLKKLKTQINAQKASLKAVREDARQKHEALRQIKQELREQQYEENAAIREAQTSLKVSRTGDPLAQAKLKLAAVNTEIGKAIEIFGRNSKEVLELLAQRQEIIAQRAQDQVNLIDAQGALRSAGLSGEGNESAKARSDLQTLESKLSYEQANANRFDPAEILQLQADIREARISLAEQVEQEAEELAEAAIDVRIAKAEAGGNDVRAARLNVQKARYTLGHADTKLERRQARSDLIGKRAALRDARTQTAIEDVEFEADIGKLTLDQQIAAYQRILQTQKLTRDARRDLRRKIYSLRKETEDDGTFDLQVGNIKLPTIYEIRRAVKGGVNGGGGVSVTQSNTFQINGARDPHGVALEINKLNGGANKAALRSAGVR